jgi:peptidoglycan glycosyltransferase
MARQLNRLSAAFLIAFLLVAAAAGYWSVVRADDLTARGDNPRRILLERRVPRGPILDRDGAVLAESVGPPGELERRYPYPLLASVLGYISPLYGAAGLEAAFDPVLHGDDGYDALELWWRNSLVSDPPPGRGLRLTLSLPLQRAADTALGGRAGALVVLGSESGEVLALASHPTFDANELETTWSDLVADPRSPLLNRAVLGLYPPGSVLAPAVLAGALGQETVTLDEPASTAPVTVGGLAYACRETADEAAVLGEALADGCPAPLAALGTTLGAERLHALFTGLRLYEPPTIGLPAGAAASEPITDPALTALGLDGMTVSPLQVALVTAAIAEHGALPGPRLVMEAQAQDGAWQPAAASTGVRTALPGTGADQVATWMSDGYAATAVSGAAGTQLAWFTAFGPADDAKTVVVVVLEDGDLEAAQAIGRQVLDSATR